MRTEDLSGSYFEISAIMAYITNYLNNGKLACDFVQNVTPIEVENGVKLVSKTEVKSVLDEKVIREMECEVTQYLFL